MMRNLLAAFALTGLLGFTACTDAYGRYDPLATGLLAAGVLGTGVALAVASNNQPRRSHGYSQPHYSRPHYSRRYYGGSSYGYHQPHPRYW